MPNGQYMNARRTNSMAVLSLIMGIFAILLFCTGFGPVIPGSLSILFAILSRGSEKHMDGSAKVGIAASVLGILIGIGLMVFVISEINSDGEFKQELDNAFIQVYGVDYDEFVRQINESSRTGETPEFMKDLEENMEKQRKERLLPSYDPGDI